MILHPFFRQAILWAILHTSASAWEEKNVFQIPEDAKEMDNGYGDGHDVHFKILKAGTGKEKPGSLDAVAIHYKGWTASDGKVYLDTKSQESPEVFTLEETTLGLHFGLLDMVVGEKRRLWIPVHLGYIKFRDPNLPLGDLVLDVELLAIKRVPSLPENAAKAPEDAEINERALKSKVLKAGKGTEHPTADDSLKMRYTVWTAKGEFLLSINHPYEDNTITHALTSLPSQRWQNAVKLMVEGEKRRMWIAELLPIPRPGHPSRKDLKGPLVIDFELIEINRSLRPPKNLQAAPEEATKTASGLKFVTLKKGWGKKPTLKDTILVRYTGWTADGKAYISTTTADGEGNPAPFSMSELIPGWKEALQLMAEGEKRRLWIPADLAYGDTDKGPLQPGGKLVFDVELLKIK